MKIMITGHRPPRLGGYHPNPMQTWCLEALDKTIVEALAKYPNFEGISGMATGSDQWFAQTLINHQVPWYAYIPFKGQETKWPKHGQELYRKLLAQAKEVKEICEPGYAAWKMHKRDKAMVNDADICICIWDGKSGGGTYATVQYANSLNKPLYHIDPTKRTRTWIRKP